MRENTVFLHPLGAYGASTPPCWNPGHATSLQVARCQVVLCDTCNRSDDNDTVSGIAILDTTAIPEMCYGILMFFRNRQSHYSSTCNHWNVCKLVCLNCLYSRPVVDCMKCAPASVNIIRSQAVARIADRTSSQHFLGSCHRPHVTWLFDTHMPFPIGFPLD